MTMLIYCAGCETDVEARLTTCEEIHPHRKDLSDIPMWKCDSCGGYVGCHHKTKNRTRPLGVIATKELMSVRKKIHAILDPLWRSGEIDRRRLYATISKRIGYEYHTGDTRSVEEALTILEIAKQIKNKVTN